MTGELCAGGPAEFPEYLAASGFQRSNGLRRKDLITSPTTGVSPVLPRFPQELPLRTLLRCAILLISACLLPAPLLAREAAPGLALVPVFESPRSHSPLQLEARLLWDDPHVLEGRLQLDFYVGEQRIHTWISRDIVLSGGELSLPVMVPSVILPTERAFLNIDATFTTAHGSYHYPEELHTLYWADWKRVQVIGVVHSAVQSLASIRLGGPSSGNTHWLTPFRLDEQAPDPEYSRHLSCRVLQVDPNRLPDQPLELAEFDVLILTREGFTQLTPRQLQALAAWTEAGGAVCVDVGQARIHAQQQFLQQLLSSLPGAPVVFDSNGQILPFLPESPAWVLASPGLGRALVVWGTVDLDAPSWRAAVLALLRLRSAQVANVVATGAWQPPPSSIHALQNKSYHPLMPDRAHQSLAELRRVLMPARIVSIPFRTVALLLGCCLLAIGPGDYFLLTWLNRRRWTWLLFPSIALATSLYAVHLAQSGIGRADLRTSMTFVDLTHEGRTARTSRYELHFAAAEKDLQQEFKQALITPMELRLDYHLDADGDPMLIPAPAGILTASAPPAFIGRVPTNYVSRRHVRQWEPQLARTTVLGPDESVAVPDFPWERITVDAMQNAQQQAQLLADLQSSLSAAAVVLLHQDQKIVRSSLSPADERLTAVLELSRKLSCPDHSGYFHLVSQIAPNAGGNFEDLALHDKTDPGQWLLLIIVPDGDGNFTIYRRLLRAETL